MKKLVIILVVLMTLVTFVACKHEKDPIKDNLAIGTWEGETNEVTFSLEVKNDKTMKMVVKYKAGEHDDQILTGTWTATSISEGTIEFVKDAQTLPGTFKAEANKLTITTEDTGPIELKKAVK